MIKKIKNYWNSLSSETKGTIAAVTIFALIFLVIVLVNK